MNEMTKTHFLGLSFLPLVGLVCYLAIPEELRHRPADASSSKVEIVDRDPRPDPSRGPLVMGEWLYRRNCSGCHGPQAVGGIRNPNYIKDTIPVLDTMALEKMKIGDSEDAKTVIDLLVKGTNLEELSEPPIAKFNVFLAQYKAIRDVIRKGNVAGKKDPSGAEPLAMPAWREKLSEDEITSILAYLLSLQKWEDEESDADIPQRPDPPVTPPEKTVSVPVNTLKEGEALPDAKLVNQDGREFKLSDLRGNVVVMSFIYTNCNLASMCPMAATRLAEAQELLTQAGVTGVRFLLVSFDSERDRPEKLKEFAVRYKVDLSTFWFATGEPSVVGPLARVLNNPYRQSAPGVYDHANVIALEDRNGLFRDDFFGTGWKTEDFIESVKRLTAAR